jgi:hypothetical protein
MRRLVVGWALFLLACGGGSTGPGPQQFEGTWAGEYTNSAAAQPFTATLRLTQDGQAIAGSLATSAGRTASLAGEAHGGDAFDATLQYTDGCIGSVTTTVSLNDEALPNELTGDYSSQDCVGQTSGSFRLLRQ